MDIRSLDARAEQLRVRGSELVAKGDNVTTEERDELVANAALIAQLDGLRIEARDAEIKTAQDEVARLTAGGERANGRGEDRAEKAFAGYLRRGAEGMLAEDRAALVAGTDANGGFVVPEPVHAPMVEMYRKVSPIMEDVTIFPMAGDTTMYLPRKETHGATANATETGARTEQTEPTFNNGSLQAFDIYSDQRAAQQFLDSVDGAEGMITRWIYEDFLEKFNAQLCTGAGTGSQQAAGLFLASAIYGTQLSGSAAALTNTSILSTFYALPQKFRLGSKWYMASTTLAVLQGMAWPNLNNTPLVTNMPDGTVKLLGKQVVEVDDAPAIGAANYPVAFGDLKQGYAVGIHKQATILRDPYTATPLVRFYGVTRMGGTPWNKNAMVLLKSNNA